MSKFLKIILLVLITPVLFQFCATVPEYLPNEYVITVTQGDVALGEIDIKMFEIPKLSLMEYNHDSNYFTITKLKFPIPRLFSGGFG